MAYEKQVWNCGDPITADKMNHIEEGIEAASDKGYGCTESWTTLTEESVTTVVEDDYPGATLAYTTLIDADTIKVNFNGVQYECNKREGLGGTVEYGAPFADGYDFSEYPFNIYSESGSNFFVTQTAGTYTIKIEALEQSVNTTECFDTATRKSVNASGNCVGITQYYDSAEDASEGVPFIPWRVSSCIFENLTAISIAQGLSQEVTLAPNRDISMVRYIAIMEIYNAQGDGLLPPITGIKTGVDAESSARTYVLKLTAKDGAISIPQYGLHITALIFEEAHTVRTICAVEGTCCEEETPE